MTTEKVLIVAGGTGGHVFPALAVANELVRQGVSVEWLGSTHGLENQWVPDTFPLHRIAIRALRGKNIFRKLLAPFQLVKALMQSLWLLRSVKPDVVLAMGGFASGPAGVAAWLLHIPLVLHEQNARPGMTNRLLSHVAKRVLQAFPDTFPGLKKVATVGNPVRHVFREIPEPRARYAQRDKRLRVLVLGGSQGAHAINEMMMQCVKGKGIQQQVDLWHQTGVNDFETVNALYSTLSMPVKASPFIKEVSEAYAWADVVVCRSGALTVAELAAAGVASVLIPFPYAVDDHQYYNGKFLKDAGGACLCRQADISAPQLAGLLNNFASNRTALLMMAERAHRKAQPNAVGDVVHWVMNRGEQ